MPRLCCHRAVLFASIAVAAGCGVRETPEPIETHVSALTRTLAAAGDTFVNSAFPDNNNGLSPSIYTGHNGQGGAMRGLIRFAMPADLQARATVSRVRLTMTTRGLSATETAAPTAAVETLRALGASWTEGNGIGSAMTQFTVGQACTSAGSTGATWNQANCVAGAWTGGTATAPASGSANVPAAIDTAVVWDSAAGGDGMVADVQSWIDNPGGNNGWRIESSTEGGTPGQSQKFYARESATSPPSLVVDFACKTGFSEVGSVCTACTAAARTACAADMQGNVCNDPGAPSTSFLCVCGHAGYTGTGTQSCLAVGNGGDAAGGSGGSGGGGGTSGGGAGGGSGSGASGASGAVGGASGAGGATGTGGASGAGGVTGAGGGGGAAGGAGGGASGAGGSGGAGGTAGASGGGGAIAGAGGGTAGVAGAGGVTGTGGAGASGGSAGTGAGGRGGAGGSAGTTGGSGESGCSCGISAQARTTPVVELLVGVTMLICLLRRRRDRADGRYQMPASGLESVEKIDGPSGRRMGGPASSS